MNNRANLRIRVLGPVLLILVLLNLLLMTRLLLPILREDGAPVSAAALTTTQELPSTTPQLTATPTPVVFPSLVPGENSDDGLRQQGAMIFSMRDGAYFHLFAYHPQYLPLTRLTSSTWDDITPAVSPAGDRLAYASQKNGYWDLYVMEIASGQVTQVTNTPAYDAAPTWSPDGNWLAYESYGESNLDIELISLADPTQPPIRLTDDVSADYAPTWSPVRGQIAFVSTRSGEADIWLADLDASENRFTNLSQNASAWDSDPAWSPDGRSLAWSASSGGLSSLFMVDTTSAEPSTRAIGSGSAVRWSPNGTALLARVDTPNGCGFSIYSAGNGLLALPYESLPGELYGMDWKGGATFIDALSPRLANSPAPLPSDWTMQLTQFPINPAGRFGVVDLAEIVAPYPKLHDAVNESFQALRQTTASRTGWDFLGSLENAFIPLTRPTTPGMGEDWLYTGRAIAVNPVLIHAGWMTVMREDVNGHAYWRVYLKARYQDGSQGKPLTQPAWDFNARYNGDPKVYEQGGQSGTVPEGYWIDFTSLALAYQWERLPALVNWVTYYPAARFNQFAATDGMDWKTALMEIYPPEALPTPTSLPRQMIQPPEQLPPGLTAP